MLDYNYLYVRYLYIHFNYVLVIKNKDKISTNLEKTGKTSDVGYSFSHGRSVIPLHFTSRDQNASRFLNSLFSPQMVERNHTESSQSKCNFN